MPLASDKPESNSPGYHRWIQRVAWLLCGFTFLLIIVGGLVTTTKAGMSVPDWPGTYGYNMFLYPLSTWWSGPWDLFVEHGHRLIAAFVVGPLSIVLAVLIWKFDDRNWMKRVGLIAVVGVVAQGILGGLRVVLDERLLAMIHGFVGPLFFALTVAIAVWTSKFWESDVEPENNPRARRLFGVVRVAWFIIFLQMIIGALLRHMPTNFVTTAFTHGTRTHIVLAGVITLLVLRIASLAKSDGMPNGIRRCGGGLVAVVLAQVALGLTAWIFKYGTPVWLRGLLPASRDAILADGWWQSHMVTAHQATGSALLGLTTILALLAWRISRTTAGETEADSLRWVVSQPHRGEIIS